MDEMANATARKRLMGIYLDVYPNLAKVRVAGSNPVAAQKKNQLDSYFGDQNGPRFRVVAHGPSPYFWVLAGNPRSRFPGASSARVRRRGG
jgi:hypothetical protein